MASITFYRNRWVVRWYRAEGRPKRSFRTREEAEANLDLIDERPAMKKGPKAGRRPVAARIQGLVKVDPNGCWLWQGKRMPTEGYGVMTIASRPTMAHRASYEASVGPIPPGLHIDHLCRVRECVNPKHLEPVTPQENTRRSPIHISVVRAAKTHCVNGHEFTPENTYRYGPQNRWRKCRACEIARQASKRGDTK